MHLHSKPTQQIAHENQSDIFITAIFGELSGEILPKCLLKPASARVVFT
jgi:hypothetical protein